MSLFLVAAVNHEIANLKLVKEGYAELHPELCSLKVIACMVRMFDGLNIFPNNE